MSNLIRPTAPVVSQSASEVIAVSALSAVQAVEPKRVPEFYVSTTSDRHPAQGVAPVARLLENSLRNPVQLEDGRLVTGFIGRTADGRLIVHRTWDAIAQSHQIEQPRCVVVLLCERGHEISVSGNCKVVQGRSQGKIVYVAFLRSGFVSIDGNILSIKNNKPVYEHLLAASTVEKPKPNKTGAASRKIKKEAYLAKKAAGNVPTPKGDKGGKGAKGGKGGKGGKGKSK